jgi:hypothetical protein
MHSHNLPIPYFRVLRDTNEDTNWGFCNLKQRPEAISEVPELYNCPAFEKLIRAINAPTSFFLSHGCAKYFSSRPNMPAEFGIMLTSYVGFAFEIAELNQDQKNFHELIERFKTFTKDVPSYKQLGVRFEVQPTTFYERQLQGWSACYFCNGLGESEDSAKRAWLLGIAEFHKFVAHENEINAETIKAALGTDSIRKLSFPYATIGTT